MTDPRDPSDRKSRARAVPAARVSRLAAFGKLAGGVAGGVLAEGARRLSRGERPRMADLLLTPGNAARVTEQLSRLRGAAMKLGQMISMDGGDVLPAELTAILARLRDDAHHMAPSQLQTVLAAEWGKDWRRRFTRFDARPIAAASIGQVHRAWLPDGRELAIKVQYPGVRESIDADVDNVATLLRLSNLLPRQLDIAPLLGEAKRQLHEEADYLREAAQMERYGALLARDPAFVVPAPHMDLTTSRVLAMDFVDARPIDTLETALQQERNRVMQSLMGLVMRELFSFGFMQTDPNFANYRYIPDTGQLVLLDFGAARAVDAATAEAYRDLLAAGLSGDGEAVRNAALRVGFLGEDLVRRHRPAIDRMIGLILSLVERPGLFDFGNRAFVAELREHAMPVASDRESWHLPPAETLFVQRKVSGTALLAVRMKAQMPLREMAARWVSQPPAG